MVESSHANLSIPKIAHGIEEEALVWQSDLISDCECEVDSDREGRPNAAARYVYANSSKIWSRERQNLKSESSSRDWRQAGIDLSHASAQTVDCSRAQTPTTGLVRQNFSSTNDVVYSQGSGELATTSIPIALSTARTRTRT